MGKKSSRKGASFERRIAKMFAAAYGCEIVRTPQSGGWGKFHTKGDLVAPTNSDFPWFVECKCDQGWNLWSAVFENKGILNGWWMKAVGQAKEEDKEPLLVIGQNVQIPLVVCIIPVDVEILDAFVPHIIADVCPKAFITRLDMFLSCVV